MSIEYKTHPLYGKYPVNVWVPVYGFPKYEVNNMSQIRNSKTKEMLKIANRERVCLRTDKNERKVQAVYRIALLSFFPDIQPLETTDHINENHYDHEISNLQWLSNIENSKKSGKLKPRKTNKRSKIVQQFSADGILINEFISTSDASKQTKIHQGSIAHCCCGDRPTAGGFSWKYKDVIPKVLSGEIWKPFEYITTKKNIREAYISNIGRIQTTKGIISYGNKEPCSKYRIFRTRRIHLIVWDAFGDGDRKGKCPITGQQLFVLHDDSIPLDNDGCYSNAIHHLRLGTQSENIKESYKIGALSKKRKRQF